jgi:protein involved in polysaccharide export with SLBB domain
MRTLLLFVFLCGTLSVDPLAAQQQNWDPRRVYMSRGDLEQLLSRLEKTVNSPVYSSALRERARQESSLIRIRLDQGDFQVGDRVLLTVEGEPALSDTFTVADDRQLDLPAIGDVPLSGLLRAELEAFLAEYLGRYIREPRVRARSLVPITLLGGVERPGFYTVPSQLLLTDALMLAGGVIMEAQIQDIRVERGDERIWEGDALQEAITAGRTLDQLNIRAGDRVVVPIGGRGIAGSEGSVRVLYLLITLPVAVAGLIAIF